jgi:uncharacterized protein
MDTTFFSIANLLNKEVGESETYNLDFSPSVKDFEGIKFKDNLNAEIILMRIDEGILVQVQNLETTISLPCQKCLIDFDFNLDIEEFERIFAENIVKIEDDTDDYFEIDMRNHKIDISEMLRQEIILHFPILEVCSKSCKGLCLVCGADLNLEKCKCRQEDEYKPLSILKEIYNGKTSSTQKKDL